MLKIMEGVTNRIELRRFRWQKTSLVEYVIRKFAYKLIEFKSEKACEP